MPHASDRQLLSVAVDANAAAYRRAVQVSAPGECWDVLVLTAANQKQADGYRLELSLRERTMGAAGAMFPAIQRTLVVPDPPGRRAGSGGATLGTIPALMDELDLSAADLVRRRILLIHSGGASQRLPMYSPLGKIFAPLPLLRPDGQIATLFDHLYITLAGLPQRLGPGLLVLAGDVLLLMDHRHVTMPGRGVTALTWRVPPQTAQDHGVFVVDRRGRIMRTLQKVSPQTMRDQGAADADGRVLIDTGLLFFDPQALARLIDLSQDRQLLGRSAGPIDLYDDMVGAMAGGSDAAAYVRAGSRALRKRLWPALHDVPLRAMQLEGEFLHLGTTRQFRDAMTGRSHSPASALLGGKVLSRSDWPVPDDACVYHSLLSGAGGSVGHGAVIEHSALGGPVIVGADSVVSQTALSGPARVGAGRLLFQVPVQMGPRGQRLRRRSAAAVATAQEPEFTSVWFVHVLCGVGDDFKAKLADGRCTYLDQPIEQWMKSQGVTARDLWQDTPPDQRTLWNARLFPATPGRNGAVAAMAMLEAPASGTIAARVRRGWRMSRRYSMAMLLEHADPQAMVEHREVIAARLQVGAYLDRIDSGQDVTIEAAVAHFATPTAYYAAVDGLSAPASAPREPSHALREARTLWAASQLLHRADHPDPHRASALAQSCRDAAFARIASASETAHASLQVKAIAAPKLRPDIEVTAWSPVRLDLSGGWSDTPPYCYERGGHVLNVAIDLDGRPPVRAAVRTLRQPMLVLESLDLGRRTEITRLPRGRPDVTDPFALHLVALSMAGLLPAGGGDMKRHLMRLGAGLHVSTECRVPKGSGLGTSSILAATLLGALHRAAGRRCSIDELLVQTLLLEQRLSTGGGWQDQVGGIVGGVKSTTTLPGVPQRPMVEKLNLSKAQYSALQDRLVVYFTGQQRLARDILRRVMGRWLAREPAIVQLMSELKQGAAAQRLAIRRADWSGVAREAARYWRIKRDLYPASTTPAFDRLLVEVKRDFQGAGLAGAGGGGFAYFLCRDGRQAERLRRRLAEHAARPGSMGAVYDTQINRRGMTITVRRLPSH
jgi:fucokinase